MAFRESTYQELLANSERFGQQVETLPVGSWIFVDEIQRLPGLLNEVHRFIEEKKFKFILTGSSSRKLRRAGTNLLAGRALKKMIHPLLPSELKEDFNLNKVLYQGSLPVIWSAPDPNAALKDYVQLYLKEEIQAEAIVRNLSGFLRFLPIAGLFHGQLINVSNIARDAGVERTTVQGFLEILEDTLLAFRISAYEAKLRVREKKHPKLYWIDPGLARVVRAESEVDTENMGCLFEGWIAQCLRSYQEYLNLYDECFYWSPSESKTTEVDFLIKKGKKFIAIEAKAVKRLRPEYFKGLKAISELKGLQRCILVYLGSQDLKVENVEVLTVSSFLKEIEGKNLW